MSSVKAQFNSSFKDFMFLKDNLYNIFMMIKKEVYVYIICHKLLIFLAYTR